MISNDKKERLFDPREDKSPPTQERLPGIVQMMWDAGLYTQAREVQRLGDAYFSSAVTDDMVERALEAAGPTTINFRSPWHDDERATVRKMLLAAGSSSNRPPIDWQEMDRLEALGTFGARIIPYNGVWKIMLNETNCELWSLKTHDEAQAKLADALKKSGYSDDENPLIDLARFRAEHSATLAPFTEAQVIRLMDAVRESGHCATNKDILGRIREERS